MGFIDSIRIEKYFKLEGESNIAEKKMPSTPDKVAK